MSRRVHRPHALVLAALLAGCGGGDHGADGDGGSVDGGRADSGGLDGAVGADGGEVADGSAGGDGGSVDGSTAADGSTVGDGGSAADGGEVPAAWETWCTVDGPDRASGCGDTFDSAGCLAIGGCVIAKFVPTAIDPLVECLAGRACGESDDPCFTFEGLGLTASDAYQAYQEDCISMRITCPPASRWSDDLCFPGLVTDAVVSELSSCLDSACGDVSDCILAVYGC